MLPNVIVFGVGFDTDLVFYNKLGPGDSGKKTMP